MLSEAKHPLLSRGRGLNPGVRLVHRGTIRKESRAMRRCSVLLLWLGSFGISARASAAVVHISVDGAKDAKPISRFIYGANRTIEGAWAGLTLTRSGGNRLTAYNWTNNASNAGSDWQFQNDNAVGGGDVPGGALVGAIQNAGAQQAGIALTIPINGYVAADKNGGGDVHQSGADYLKTRFRPSLARKPGAFTLTPAPNSPIVYQDEFAHWVKTKYPYGFIDPQRPIFYCLDNEPDLWPSTHKEIHPEPTTYAELIGKTIDYAVAIKAVSPKAVLFGPGNYGWQGYINLQNAPDAKGRDFQEVYLKELAQAERAHHQRLLDVFDVHWYPEAQGDGVRVGAPESRPAVAEARVQAPRSLWDPTYTETSWITQWSTKGPIKLLPRLRAKVDANYPGTRIAVMEYNYGGGGHISGALAQADVLGIFGREGVFAAAEWPMAQDETYIAAAFRMFRDFDGHGATFGDTSVSALTDDVAATSVYAALDSKHPGVLSVVLLNKTDHPVTAECHLAHTGPFAAGEVYQLTSAGAAPRASPGIVLKEQSAFIYDMPASSVSTLRLTPAGPLSGRGNATTRPAPPSTRPAPVIRRF